MARFVELDDEWHMRRHYASDTLLPQSADTTMTGIMEEEQVTTPLSLSDEQFPLGLQRRHRVGRMAVRSMIAGLALTAPVAAGLAGVTFGPSTHTTFAGLEATSHARLGQDASNLDLGILGSVQSARHNSYAGIDVGVDIQINGDQLSLDDAATRAALGQVLSRPDPEIEHVGRATARSTAEHFGIGAGTMLGLEVMAGGIILGRRRFYGRGGEKLMAEQIGWNRLESKILAGVGILALAGTCTIGLAPVAHPNHQTVVPDVALMGTPLQGMQLKGALHDVAPVLISATEPQQKLTETMTTNTQELIAQRPNLLPQDGWTYFAVADDLQDRSSMATEFGVLGKELGLDFLAMNGDWSSFNKFGFGSYMMDTVRYESGGIETWSVNGDHDNELTNQYAIQAGMQVGDNKTHLVNNIPMLFLQSVRVSQLGAQNGSTLRYPDIDAETAINNAVQEICDTHPGVILVHDHREGRPIAIAAIKAGCAVPAIIDGRSFEYVGPSVITVPGYPGQTVEFTLGSSGAHTDTSIDLGPIRVPAKIVEFALNNTTGELAYAPFTYHPDGTVTAPESLTTLIAPSVPDTDVPALQSQDKKDQPEVKAAQR